MSEAMIKKGSNSAGLGIFSPTKTRQDSPVKGRGSTDKKQIQPLCGRGDWEERGTRYLK